MLKHKYGLKMPDFYIEWSLVYEKKKDLKEAINVLELGLKQECLKSNYKLNVHLNRLKSEQTEQPPKVLIQKFAFDYNLIYPDKTTNEEYSFEERRAQVLLSAYAKYEIKEKQYINEINELKFQ
jgi:hypothetical protein